MAVRMKYGSGNDAIALNPDGTGYAYYPNGAVAVAVSCASDYQNSFFAFDRNRKSTVLLGVDELGIGFATSASRKSAEVEQRMIALSKVGCIVSEKGDIIHEWRWDRSSMNCGVEPSRPIETNLNEYLVFTLKDRSTMSLAFSCEGITHLFDLGAKVRRTDCYLDNCARQPGGHLVPQIPHVTLMARQTSWNESMKAQRNKLHPKSENLSDLVKDIVSGLETRFEGVDEKMSTTPGAGTEWKDIALSATLREIPRIPIAGTETGVTPGFGTQIYVKAGETDLSKTLPANLIDSKGKWKGEVEVRTVLREENPPLPRSWVLGSNSGRYSAMLVVDKNSVTADNPTGMITALGTPLAKIRWSKLKEITSGSAGLGMGLLVVLLLREGDVRCIAAEKVAELVNIDVSGPSTSLSASSRGGTAGGGPAVIPGSAASTGNLSHIENMKQAIAKGVQLLKMDVGENNEVVQELGIKHLPTFLMYQGRNLMYCGVVGGQKIKVGTSQHKPQVLLVEPDVKHQIYCEKTLRRYGCDSFLCLSVSEAVERERQFSSRGSGKSSIVLDLVLISESVSCSDLHILNRQLADSVSSRRTIVCGLVSVLGERGGQALRAVRWEEGFTSDCASVLPSPLVDSVHAAIQKPIKPAALERLLSMRVIPAEDENYGLSPETLVAKIREVQEGGRDPLMSTAFVNTTGGSTAASMSAGAYVGIRLSAEDVKMRGTTLVRK